MEAEVQPPPPTDQPQILIDSRIEKLPPRPAPTQGYSWANYSPNAHILYIRDSDQANLELSKLKVGPLGFDLEWRPNYVKGEKANPVALVQLANDEMILLLQVSAMREFPSKLIEVLENPAFVKAGVGILEDVVKLYVDWDASVRGCVDLSLLARTVDNARWKGKYSQSIGLARLVEVYHYRILEKGKVSRSNWQSILNPEQQFYASNDAHAGYTLYNHLIGMLNHDNPPEPRCYSFDSIRAIPYEPNGVFVWRAHNPNYDPGPPPPPKIRPLKADKVENTSTPTPDQDTGPSSTKRQASIAMIERATVQRQRQPVTSDGTRAGEKNFNQSQQRQGFAARNTYYRKPRGDNQGATQQQAAQSTDNHTYSPNLPSYSAGPSNSGQNNLLYPQQHSERSSNNRRPYRSWQQDRDSGSHPADGSTVPSRGSYRQPRRGRGRGRGKGGRIADDQGQGQTIPRNSSEQQHRAPGSIQRNLLPLEQRTG